MAQKDIGDYFISDDDASFEDDDFLASPVVVPIASQPVPEAPPPPAVTEAARPAQEHAPRPAPFEPEPPAPVAAQPAPPPPSAPVSAPPAQPAQPAAPVQPPARPAAPSGPQAAAPYASREAQLAEALDALIREDGEIQAAALVSLDGFTIASALPEGMEADRIGAMSAAILGLGERAAAELGRGRLSQVFIEGQDGYVLLIAAGSRAVLTVMADPHAKLGLVLYDMKTTAERIGRILG